MLIFPAIDIIDKKAVRLYKGDYSRMTVYSEDPVQVAMDFKTQGASYIHLVDLEGAKNGETPNFDVITEIVKETGLFAEVGGGIRSINVIEKYLNAGLKRVILGTSAVTDENFLNEAVKEFGEAVAVGIDLKGGFVAIKGWTEVSEIDGLTFCRKLESIGVKTVICTDISRDGAMQGTNHELYKELSLNSSLNITASGGVSTIEDIIKLKELNIYGAIIGKAYYTKAINLKEAIEAAR